MKNIIRTLFMITKHGLVRQVGSKLWQTKHRFESQPRQTYVVKTGCDCSTDKRSSKGVGFTGPQ